MSADAAPPVPYRTLVTETTRVEAGMADVEGPRDDLVRQACHAEHLDIGGRAAVEQVGPGRAVYLVMVGLAPRRAQVAVAVLAGCLILVHRVTSNLAASAR